MSGLKGMVQRADVLCPADLRAQVVKRYALDTETLMLSTS